MDNIECLQNELQENSSDLLAHVPILQRLKELGDVTQTGSSVTGLMVYPDLDFAIQNDAPDFDRALQLIPSLFSELGATAIKLADFRTPENRLAGYYIGFDLPYKGMDWHIDATVGPRGPIVTNPPELANWIESMSAEQRITILSLKKQLVDTKRYVGSKSQPPFTFRSTHVYEGVIVGNVSTIVDLEEYFSQKSN